MEWTAEATETLRAKWAEGMFLTDLAMLFGTTVRAVEHKTRRMELERRPPGIRVSAFWTAEKRAALAKLWGEGHTTVAIGVRLGCTKNSVIGRVHRDGLTSRPSPIKPSPLLAKTPAPIPAKRPHGGDGALPAQRTPIRRAPDGEPWSTGGDNLFHKAKPGSPKKAELVLATIAATGSRPPAPVVNFNAVDAAIRQGAVPSSKPRARDCQWVDGERPRWRPCCEPAAHGLFCAAHAAIAYRSIAGHERRDAARLLARA